MFIDANGLCHTISEASDVMNKHVRADFLFWASTRICGLHHNFMPIVSLCLVLQGVKEIITWTPMKSNSKNVLFNAPFS